MTWMRGNDARSPVAARCGSLPLTTPYDALKNGALWSMVLAGL